MDPFGLRAVAGHRASLTLLLMLLAVDLYYIVRHLRTMGHAFLSYWYVDDPQGYAEAFQTLQWLWCIGLLVLIAVLLRRWAFATLLPLFAFLMLTDTFEIHERVGTLLVDTFAMQPMFGLRAQDFGELIVMGVAAVVTVPLALIGMWRARPSDRPHFLRIFVLLALVFLFGVVLDMVHIWIAQGPGDVISLIEDGGEMLSASLLVAYLFWVWISGSRAPREAPDAASVPDDADLRTTVR